MNQELEEVCKECLRLDLRGYPVDMIFMIKEKRDEYVLKFVEEGKNDE